MFDTSEQKRSTGNRGAELGVIGKLKVNNGRGKQNKAPKTKSQFIEASSNMAIILNPLKEPFNNMTLLVLNSFYQKTAYVFSLREFTDNP